jgi:hypothetical protein
MYVCTGLLLNHSDWNFRNISLNDDSLERGDEVTDNLSKHSLLLVAVVGDRRTVG